MVPNQIYTDRLSPPLGSVGFLFVGLGVQYLETRAKGVCQVEAKELFLIFPRTPTFISKTTSKCRANYRTRTRVRVCLSCIFIGTFLPNIYHIYFRPHHRNQSAEEKKKRKKRSEVKKAKQSIVKGTANWGEIGRAARPTTSQLFE